MLTIKIKNYFRFNDLQTTFRNEILGGITTFLAMMYILSVQPSMLSIAPDINHLQDPAYNMSFGGVFIATALVSFLATFIMGMLANMPAGLAPGMGLNAIFTFNVAKNDLGYQGALIAVMIAAVIFLVISLTPIRQKITAAIPKTMKLAIGAGIGFFIAYLGFHNIGILADTQAIKNPLEFNKGLPIASLANLKVTWPAIFLGLLVFGVMLFLHLKKIPGAIAIAIIFGLIISLIVGQVSSNSFIIHNFSKFEGWNYADLKGFSANITNTFKEVINIKIWTSPTFYVAIFVFLFVDFFDSTGTFYAMSKTISQQAKIDYPTNSKALVADAIGSVAGGILGCGTVTTMIESNTGVIQGARTGFASVITSLMFLVAIILFPLFKLITPMISGSAMIFVGILMASQIKEIEWVKIEDITTAFLTILLMVITFSITNGIAAGFISYVVISLMKRKYHQINLITLSIAILFVLYFVALGFVQ